MKQLTVIAVNTILHARNVFHHDNYTLQSIANIKIPILKRHCKDEDAQFLSSALTKAFDAFDKKYVSNMLIEYVLILFLYIYVLLHSSLHNMYLQNTNY